MKTLLSAAVALAFASSAMAYQVYCNFQIPHPGVVPQQEDTWSVTTDYVEYMVTVGVGETLSDFWVGYWTTPTAYYVSTDPGPDNPIAEWTGGQSDLPFVPGGDNPTWIKYDEFTPDGMVSAPPSVTWNQSLYYHSGVALGPGTYYIGYSVPLGTYELLDVGWNCDTAQTENWTMPVSGGLGPVHAPIPEPGTMALVGVGAGVLALRRRLQKK